MTTELRTRVPLVTWSDAAVERVARAWREVQFRDTCDRMLYMYAYDWGITSQMRDYGDLLIVSALAFNRTLVLVQDAPRPKWCLDDSWLECFFEPLSTSNCAKSVKKLEMVRAVKAWPDVVNGTEDIALALDAQDSIMQLVRSARFVNLVNDTSYFPTPLWRNLLDRGEVRVQRSDGIEIRDMHAFCRRHRKQLCHTLALSALRTMLSQIVFRPKPDILAAVDAKVRQLQLRGQRHCLAVHLRWTDKASDGGLARLLTNHTIAVEGMHRALGRVKNRTGLAYRCLLVMSDDDGAAVRLLQTSLGDAYDIIPLSNVSSLFSSPAEYEAYRRQGHEYVQSALMVSDALAPSLATSRYYDYYRSVIADVWTTASATTADYFVGVGTSGVSQLTAQLMGARRMADGNAFTIWQEDVARE